MKLEEVLARFDATTEALLTDPDGFCKKLEAELAEEHGEQWVKDHRKQLDADWQGIRELFGF